MTLIDKLITEIEEEASNTKRMLECVPADKFDWQPHEKSMTLKQLATHVAHLSSWPELVLQTKELDFANNDLETPQIEHTTDLVTLLQKGAKASVSALQNAAKKDLEEAWVLRNGDVVLLNNTKYEVIRSMSVNHLIHHRGQLSVYLRLLDIPIPGMYGPSADDRESA